jgi:hypothetical protein
MKQEKWQQYYKLFFGLLGLSAIVTEIVVLISRGYFDPANFFSYFTIQSNLIAAVVLLKGSAGGHGRQFALFRGAVTLYMVMTGVVFALLLSGLKDISFTAVPWDNVVLHYIMPVAVLLDWLLDTPKIKLTWRRALAWLAFPLVYVVYTLIRGPIAGWYPYPFLNPEVNGYVGVIAISLGIVTFAMAIVWMLVWRVKRAL